MATRTDPVLCAQLERAAADDRPVQAVIGLRSDALAGDDVTPVAEELLARAERQTGAQAQDHNVFGRLGAFVVVAPAAFIEALLAQPEVESAMANQQPEPVVEPLARRSGG